MKKVYNPYLKRSISRNYIEKIQRNRLGAEITFPLRDITDVLSGWEGDFSGYSLLDIGCGTGNISNHESIKRFKSYVGIEPSIKIIIRSFIIVRLKIYPLMTRVLILLFQLKCGII